MIKLGSSSCQIQSILGLDTLHFMLMSQRGSFIDQSAGVVVAEGAPAPLMQTIEHQFTQDLVAHRLPYKKLHLPPVQELAEKVYWITGASSGIGKELATQLSKKGAKIILSARSTKALEALQSELGAAKVRVLPLDLEKGDTLTGLVEEALAMWGHIDVMVHNAGISQRSDVLSTELSVDRRLMEVNYFGTVILTKALLPHFVARGKGHFLVVTSAVGKVGYGMRSAYAASKHALHGFFESLYIENASRGIELTLACPGPVNTAISVHALDASGKPSGKMDAMQLKGMDVGRCAASMLRALQNKQKEVVIGSFKTTFGVWLRGVWPKLFFKLALKQDPQGQVKF